MRIFARVPHLVHATRMGMNKHLEESDGGNFDRFEVVWIVGPGFGVDDGLVYRNIILETLVRDLIHLVGMLPGDASEVASSRGGGSERTWIRYRGNLRLRIHCFSCTYWPRLHLGEKTRTSCPINNATFRYETAMVVTLHFTLIKQDQRTASTANAASSPVGLL